MLIHFNGFVETMCNYLIPECKLTQCLYFVTDTNLMTDENYYLLYIILILDQSTMYEYMIIYFVLFIIFCSYRVADYNN